LPLLIEPLRESGAALEVQALEEFPAIQPLEDRRRLSLFEVPDVDLELLSCEGDLAVSTGLDRPGAQGAAEEVEGLAKRVSGTGLVAFRPEQGGEMVPSDELSGMVEDEVREQPQPLGLGQDRLHAGPVFPGQRRSAKHPEVEHRSPPEVAGRSRSAVIGALPRALGLDRSFGHGQETPPDHRGGRLPR
jgi:hypothetical protein